MPLSVLNRLNNWRWYWKTRQLFKDKVLYGFWKYYFQLSYQGGEGRRAVGILRRSAGIILQGIAYALISIAAFEYLDHLYPALDVISKLHWQILIQFDSPAIDSFLTTVASMSGVFLALYFAAVSAVAGNLLVSAPDEVRRLFLEERQGLQYIRTLVLTAVISIFYLIFKSSGFDISLYGLFFLLILTVHNIAVFGKLGVELFSLRSRQAAADVTGEIARWVNGATSYWKNAGKPFMQNHYSTQASRHVTTFKRLIEFGKKDNLFSLEQMRDFCRYAGGLLIYYPEHKRKIPTASLWYKTRQQQKKWILTDAIEITLALNSGTGLSPIELRDFSWFEREVAEIISILQNHFLERRDADSITVATEVYVQIMEMGIAKNLSTEEVALLIKHLNDCLDNVYAAPLAKKELLAIADSDGRVAIGCLLGFVRYIEQFSNKWVDTHFSRAKIASGEIYDGTLPQAFLVRAEEFFSQLQNERKILGTLKTPDWYIKNLLVFHLLTAELKYFEYLKSLHQGYFEKRIDNLIGKKELFIAAQLLQRWLEFCNKYQTCVSVMAKHFEEMSPYNLQHDFDWAKFDKEKEEAAAEALGKTAVDKMTRLLPLLGANPQGFDGAPDYLGQALTFGVEACYQASRDNDVERFKRVFPSVFVGSLAAFYATREDTKGWPQESQLIFSSEPLVDLIEISGYAKLYAELYENDALWKACQEVWDRYLAQEGSSQMVQLITGSVIYRNSVFKLMPKGTLRTNWELEFRGVLHERGLLVDDLYTATRNNRTPVNHPSKLIRVLGTRGILPVHPDNVFFVTYLKKQAAAKGVEFPEGRDQLERFLQEDEPVEDENI